MRRIVDKSPMQLCLHIGCSAVVPLGGGDVYYYMAPPTAPSHVQSTSRNSSLVSSDRTVFDIRVADVRYFHISEIFPRSPFRVCCEMEQVGNAHAYEWLLVITERNHRRMGIWLLGLASQSN